MNNLYIEISSKGVLIYKIQYNANELFLLLALLQTRVQ